VTVTGVPAAAPWWRRTWLVVALVLALAVIGGVIAALVPGRGGALAVDAGGGAARELDAAGAPIVVEIDAAPADAAVVVNVDAAPVVEVDAAVALAIDAGVVEAPKPRPRPRVKKPAEIVAECAAGGSTDWAGCTLAACRLHDDAHAKQWYGKLGRRPAVANQCKQLGVIVDCANPLDCP
jgi:hypothetical protein